ncbi:MAG: SpoIIIAH-like family protein [Bacilli bacterium]|nr:SpoIIIAH-like family protein [Bacilli bacterium]
MINKKKLWFLTLFSLILVLSVYYITMPSELLLTNNSNYVKEDESDDTDVVMDVEESDVLEVMKNKDLEEYLDKVDSLKLILTNKDTSVEDKNEAFEQMKNLNINKTEEENLEKKVNTELNLKSFVKINNDQIKVVVLAKEHDTALANKIMRFIQTQYEKKMYITVEFK